jgi:tetratricopeptide (TPR) repeat protein
LKYLASGKQYLVSKDFRRALLAYQNAASLNPKNADSYYGIGMSQLGAGDAANALGAFSKALERDPNHAATQLKLAELLVTAGRKDLVTEAEKHARKLLENSPENVNALNALAFAESILGNDAEAENHLREALRKEPGNLNTLLTLALLHLDNSDVAGALQILKSATEKSPQSPLGWVALAEVCRSLGKTDEAKRHLIRAVDLDPAFPPALFALATLQVRTNQFDEAARTYEKIAALPNPELQPLHAVFLLSHGRPAEGIQELERLRKSSPAERRFRSLLVAAYVRSGRAGDAARVLAEALKKNPKDTEALVQQSALALGDNKVDAAAAALTSALSFAPDMAVAHYLMAHVHRARDLRRLDRNELTRALECDPMLLAARVELAAGMLEPATASSAVQVLDAAPEKQKQNLAVQVLRNWALISLGKWPELEQSTSRLLADSSFPDLLLQSALARMRKDDFAGSKPLIDSVLRQTPEDLRAVNALVGWYGMQKRAAEGLSRVQEHAARHPRSALLQLAVGELLLKDNNLRAARIAFETARHLDPEAAVTQLNLVRLDILENKPDSARLTLKALLAKRPANLMGHLLLAEVEAGSQQYDQAVEEYLEVLKLDSDNVTALNNAAAILSEKLADPVQALAYAERAVALAPDNPDTQDTLGWVYFIKNVPSAALTHLEVAASKKTTARNQFRLAMVHRRLGNLKRSSDYLNTALHMNPKIASQEQIR